MKNTLSDLNNHLFLALERLNDENISSEDLEREINRCDAITKVASTIVNTANIQLQAYKYVNGESASAYREVPQTLLGHDKNE